MADKTPEFEPPQACVARIIKNVLPESAQVTKEARSAFTRAAGIFIFYLTHCANEFSKEAKRTTIQTQDVLNALKELDFESFDAPLQEFLEAYRKEEEMKKVGKSKKGSSSTSEEGEEDGAEEGENEEGGEHLAKRARTSSEAEGASAVEGGDAEDGPAVEAGNEEEEPSA